jgi:hypothetical protein
MKPHVHTTQDSGKESANEKEEGVWRLHLLCVTRFTLFIRAHLVTRFARINDLTVDHCNNREYHDGKVKGHSELKIDSSIT